RGKRYGFSHLVVRRGGAGAGCRSGAAVLRGGQQGPAGGSHPECRLALSADCLSHLGISLYLAFGATGRLRIGGIDAEPEFSTATWLAMLFAAGMGIGLVFWGAAEPISHVITPPEGLPPKTPQAARAAMRYTFFHWGLHPWAIYALMGLAIAWFQYNRNGRGLISDLLQPLIGDRHLGWMGKLVNIVAVVATAIGVATDLVFGSTQISAGMASVFGLPTRAGAQLSVIGPCFVLYVLSSLSGQQHGIKWLSSFNLALA